MTCTRRRTVQAAPLAPVLAKVVKPPLAPVVWVTLPVANVTKDLHQGIEVFVGGEPAHVVPRMEIARREASYVRTIIEDAKLPLSADAERFLVNFFGYTSGPWSAYRERFDSDNVALRAFLADAAGATIDATIVKYWCERSDDIKGVLLNYLDDAPTPIDVVQHPILALAGMLASGAGELRATRAIREVAGLLEHVANTAKAPSPESDLMNVVANYATRVDLMAACAVRPEEPFQVETVERRSLHVEHRWTERATVNQDFVIADANSNHVGVVVTDAHVELRGVTALQPRGSTDAILVAGAAEHSAEAFTFYASNPDRDYVVRLRIELGLAPMSHLVMGTMLIVVLVALGLLVAKRPMDSTSVSVLVVPTTFAASALLVRERSSLGARLRQWWTIAIAVVLLLLWGVVSWLFATDKVSEGASSTARGTVRMDLGDDV